jgi:DNA-binding transcriptional MocR family regulator
MTHPCDIPDPDRPPMPPTRAPKGAWVQTERAAHEAWAALTAKAPKAAQLMHLLTARVGEHNAVVVSQATLSELMKCSRRTVQRALDVLVQDRWIELRQIGPSGTVNAHVLNDRVVWNGPRDGIRYSLFSAAVILSDREQPDSTELGQQEPLRRVPSLFPGEAQLPAGPGLEPPSQPFLGGMEPDLPATQREQDDGKGKVG